MIKLLIIGGKLQGIEIAYLASEAGYYTIVVDKNKDIPASGLVDEHRQMEVFEEKSMLKLFKEVDIVFPAIENKLVLDQLIYYEEITGTKVVFDQQSYGISSSKQKSNSLFKELGLPMPDTYPNCPYPIIIKPDGLSGSANVKKLYSEEEVALMIESMEGDYVIQAYMEGRSFSIEVIGDGDHFYMPQITEVVIDQNYDCKRIIAPAQISLEEEAQFIEIAKVLAGKLRIKGVFDIEVISHKGSLKLLEIDARFPSQTPVSVYNASGINMVEMLTQMALGNFKSMKASKAKVCYYQQIEVNEREIKVLGEHAMARCQKLKRVDGFFGADEGLTDYAEGKTRWKAIVIVIADSYHSAYDKFLTCIENIKEKMVNDPIAFVEG